MHLGWGTNAEIAFGGGGESTVTAISYFLQAQVQRKMKNHHFCQNIKVICSLSYITFALVL